MVAPLIPATWEDRLGDVVEATLTAGHRTCKRADGQRALDSLVNRLRTAGGIDRAVRIEVVDDGMVNAFTLPGGRVIVMRGLVRYAGDGAELAGVIAHELGHVAHRDPTTMLLRQFGIGFISRIVWPSNDAIKTGGSAGLRRTW